MGLSATGGVGKAGGGAKDAGEGAGVGEDVGGAHTVEEGHDGGGIGGESVDEVVPWGRVVLGGVRVIELEEGVGEGAAFGVEVDEGGGEEGGDGEAGFEDLGMEGSASGQVAAAGGLLELR